jgi:hypothetical protein
MRCGGGGCWQNSLHVFLPWPYLAWFGHEPGSKFAFLSEHQLFFHTVTSEHGKILWYFPQIFMFTSSVPPQLSFNFLNWLII